MGPNLRDTLTSSHQEERDSVGMNQPGQGGQQPSGMPSWTNNLTARGTKPGPGGVALADFTDRAIAAFIDFLILGIIGAIVANLSRSGPRSGSGLGCTSRACVSPVRRS